MTLELIAELSGAHGGSLENALKLIHLAKRAGATGVKFQCFDPARLAIRRAGQARIQKMMGTDDLPVSTASKLRDLYRQIHTPREWFPELIRWAKSYGLTWHASVFDPEDVAFLETLDCPRYKIASFEAHDRDVIAAVERTGKPVIISANQNEDVTPSPNALVLHATDYGVPASKAHLARLRWWHDGHVMSHGQQWKWGLSDHTTSGPLAGMVAAALGASMIEWHIRLPEVSTPDDAFAWTVGDLAHRVICVREVEEAMNG